VSSITFSIGQNGREFDFDPETDPEKKKPISTQQLINGGVNLFPLLAFLN